MADEALDLEEARANTQGSISEENVALETVPEAAPNGGSTLPAEAEHKIFTSISVDKVIILSFRGLQLRRIAEMQDNLLDMAVATAKEGEVTDEQRTKIDQALKGYADALRTYETLSLNSLPAVPPGSRLIGLLGNQDYVAPEPKKGFRMRLGIFIATHVPPFVIHLLEITRQMNLFILHLVFPAWPQYVRFSASEAAISAINYFVRAKYGSAFSATDVMAALEASAGNLGFRELDQQGRLKRAQKAATAGRITMAMFGGTALVAPVLIMVLLPSRNTYLITVSVATFLMALTLGLFATDSTGKDVLAGTAAYAAVLGVFVGTTQSTPGP